VPAPGGQSILTAPRINPRHFFHPLQFLILRSIYKFYSTNFFFLRSLCNIYPNFRFFAPLLWAAAGGGALPCPLVTLLSLSPKKLAICISWKQKCSLTLFLILFYGFHPSIQRYCHTKAQCSSSVCRNVPSMQYSDIRQHDSQRQGVF